jgi:putative inorganic carbon (HCO3(-)) transporter
MSGVSPSGVSWFGRRQPLAALWALAALSAGLLIAQLPVTYTLAVLAGGCLAAVALWEPAIGLGLAIVLGPAKALLAVSYPTWPSDLGQLFLALAAAGWLARGLAQRRVVIPSTPVLLPLGLYLAVGLFSLLPATSLEDGLKEALKWAEIGLGLVILLSEAERGRLPWLVGAILAAGLGQAAIGIWEYRFRGTGPATFLVSNGIYRAYGTFEQPNPYGGFLGLIWPLAAGLGVGWLALWFRRPKATLALRVLLRAGLFLLAAAFMLAGLYVSASRGAWLGAAAAALTMALFLPRRLAVGAGLVAAALAIGFGLWQAGLLPASLTSRLAGVTDFLYVTDVRGININDTNFALVERLAHWQAGISLFAAHPWQGVGWGNYAAAYPAVSLLNWPNALGHAHNIYLNVGAETGAVGLLAYVLLWGWIIALTIRVLNRTGGVERGLALGLIGAWAHLSAHQIVDDLYVNNIHILLAGLLALLVYLAQNSARRRSETATLTLQPLAHSFIDL